MDNDRKYTSSGSRRGRFETHWGVTIDLGKPTTGVVTNHRVPWLHEDMADGIDLVWEEHALECGGLCVNCDCSHLNGGCDCTPEELETDYGHGLDHTYDGCGEHDKCGPESYQGSVLVGDWLRIHKFEFSHRAGPGPRGDADCGPNEGDEYMICTCGEPVWAECHGFTSKQQNAGFKSNFSYREILDRCNAEVGSGDTAIGFKVNKRDENGKGYVAIMGETYSQVIWSKTVRRVRSLCSPCFPGQADVRPPCETFREGDEVQYTDALCAVLGPLHDPNNGPKWTFIVEEVDQEKGCKVYPSAYRGDRATNDPEGCWVPFENLELVGGYLAYDFPPDMYAL